MNTDKITGILHLGIGIIINLYAFIFAKNPFDILYILFMFAAVLSWTIYNGECWLSYYTKKKSDPTYIAGRTTDDVRDVRELSGIKNPVLVKSYFFLMLCINCVSLYLVLLRNAYSVLLSRLYCMVYIIYMVFSAKYKYGIYPHYIYTQNVYKMVFIGLSALIMYDKFYG